MLGKLEAEFHPKYSDRSVPVVELRLRDQMVCLEVFNLLLLVRC